jgi:tight adherence protein B
MGTIIVVFAAFFLVAVLVLFTIAAPGRKEEKQVMTRLEQIRAPQSEAEMDESFGVRRVDHLSALPWLDEVLRRVHIAESLRLLLYQANLQWTVARLLLVSVLLACAAGCLVYLRTGAEPLAFLIGILASGGPFLYVLQKRSSRFDRMRQYLPEALDLMVSAIRAGHSFSSAMGMAAKECPEPIRREFRQCFDEQNFGLELRVALLNLAYRVPIHDVRITVTAVLIQNESGGNLTEILDKVAYLIREDFKLQRQVRVHTAQGRLTGWILSLLPPILGVLLYMSNPSNMSVLWTRPEGRKMLYAATVMTLTGGLIIRKIIRIRV